MNDIIYARPVTASDTSLVITASLSSAYQSGTIVSGVNQLENRVKELEDKLNSFRIPQTCVRCGAPLSKNKCDYCGTEYAIVPFIGGQ